MITGKPLVASVVGMDGCGKSSTFRGALNELVGRIRVVGIGEQVWSGGPDEPLRERLDIPLSRSAQIIGRFAKNLRWQRLYKNLKFVELTERTRICDYVTVHDPPDVILTDGQPLVNCAAWSVAHFYKEDLRENDEELFQGLRYLAGEEAIPLRELPRYLRRAWPLVLLNRLRLGRFRLPDLIFLLDLDPAVAMARIRARGKPLQAHETETLLGELGSGYVRVCNLLQERCGIPVTTIRVDQASLEETVQIVADGVLEKTLKVQQTLKVSEDLVEKQHAVGQTSTPKHRSPELAWGVRTAASACRRQRPPTRYGVPPEVRFSTKSSETFRVCTTIDVIATTISGSIQDQRKVGQIEPAFRARTSRPVRVHVADSHTEAQAAAHTIVAEGGRIVVSAGGAGTFNAVLEGAHLNGTVPSDLHLAFLRKGSADLIGKVLRIPDKLPAAVDAIVGGIEAGRSVPADILAVETTEPDGRTQRRHLVGFGGVGVFGDVPRFTESRLIKVYKGVLSSLFGDLGPFFVGLTLATGWWQLQRLLGRIPRMSLTLDDEYIPPETWAAVVVLNGNLGSDFPLGRDLPLGSGSFRVISLRYGGLRPALQQIKAARRGTLLDEPERYGAVIRTVRRCTVRPTEPRPYMVNVDGLRMVTRGEVRVTVSGQVWLISGLPGDQEPRIAETRGFSAVDPRLPANP